MAQLPLRSNVIRLGQLDPNAQLLVEKDGDRLVVTPDEAIDAVISRDQAKDMLARRDLFERQMRLLTDRLVRWFTDHRLKLADAFLQTKSDCQMFLVVLRGNEYDPDIEAGLSELSIEIAGDPAFSMVRLDVQALPFCQTDDVRSFIDQDA